MEEKYAHKKRKNLTQGGEKEEQKGANRLNKTQKGEMELRNGRNECRNVKQHMTQ